MPMVDSSLAEREEVPITSKDVPTTCPLHTRTHPVKGNYHDVSPDGGKASLQVKSSQVKDHRCP